ncbi:MAG: hypothetical protein J5699_01555 [Bacteroidales bacterium]|nr:hypothetical protein [Bacteroidales bacterium]
MKKFIASVLVISIAMMGTLSYNAAAKGPNNHKGNGPRIENHGNRPSGNHHGDNAFRPGNDKPGNNHGNVGHNNGHHANVGHGHATPAPRPAVRPAPRPEPRPAPRPRHRRPAGYRVARAIDRAAVMIGDAIAVAAVNAAIGAIVTALPPYHVEVIINGRVYYLADNILYSPVVINGIPCFEVVDNRYIY